jgi:adenine phosphoribosyltransferase
MNSVNIDDYIRKVPDFPNKGVLFYDITGIITAPPAFSWCIDKMVETYAGKKLDAVAAVEARGFLFAAPFAREMKLPLVLIRKKGKLPGRTLTKKYDLEYGSAELELHVSDVPNGGEVLLVDDLIATGGTLQASRELLIDAGATVREVFGVIGLPFLGFQDCLPSVNVTTLIDYESE